MRMRTVDLFYRCRRDVHDIPHHSNPWGSQQTISVSLTFMTGHQLCASSLSGTPGTLSLKGYECSHAVRASRKSCYTCNSPYLRRRTNKKLTVIHSF